MMGNSLPIISQAQGRADYVVLLSGCFLRFV